MKSGKINPGAVSWSVGVIEVAEEMLIQNVSFLQLTGNHPNFWYKEGRNGGLFLCKQFKKFPKCFRV